MSDTKNTIDFVKEFQKTLNMTHDEIIDKRLETIEFVESMIEELGEVMNTIGLMKCVENREFNDVSEMISKYKLEKTLTKLSECLEELENYTKDAYLSLRESLVGLHKESSEGVIIEINKYKDDPSYFTVTGKKVNDYKVLLEEVAGYSVSDKKWELAEENLEELIEHLEYVGLVKYVDFVVDE